VPIKGACFAFDGDVYVKRLSTRKVKDMTEALCGTSFSKNLVSSLAAPCTLSFRHGGTGPLKPKSTPTCF